LTRKLTVETATGKTYTFTDDEYTWIWTRHKLQVSKNDGTELYVFPNERMIVVKEEDMEGIVIRKESKKP